MTIPNQNISWIAEPLLCTWEQHHPKQVTFQQELHLLENGDVFIRNRSFARFDPVDYTFPGGRAFRERDSNTLVIRCNGPNPEIYVFQYRSLLRYFWRAWYRLVPRLN